jgi:ubiquitin carboxyl-terminal hydrolase 4/11/15
VAETQLPTPPNEPTQFEIGSSSKVQPELPSHEEHLRSTENDGAWDLRPTRSNAESSVPSPPAEDLPDYDDYHSGSYAIDFLRQRFSFPDPAQKASPTSSNEAEADADIDTDIDQDDREWEEMPNLEIRGGLPLDASYSDMDKQYDWDAADTFGLASVQDDHFIDLKEDKPT